MYPWLECPALKRTKAKLVLVNRVCAIDLCDR